jgi:hypothetical protein
MVHKIFSFFDKLEDKVRARLSHAPIVYSFIGGVGIVLFWKGVWEMAEAVHLLDGFGSLALGTVILLMSGLLVSFFIGDTIIISGLKRDKKIAEKTEQRIRTESDLIIDVERKLADMQRQIGEIQEKL